MGEKYIRVLSYWKEKVYLWSYTGVKHPNCIPRNAAEIMPIEYCKPYPGTNDFAMGANNFRWALLSQRKEIWIDADLICKKMPKLDAPAICGGFIHKGKLEPDVFFMCNNGSDKFALGYERAIKRCEYYNWKIQRGGNGSKIIAGLDFEVLPPDVFEHERR